MVAKDYIYPIYSGGTIIGQGFIADGFFITAAHLVVDYPSCYVVIKGTKMELAKTEPIFYLDDDDYHYDSQLADVVLFHFDNDSPLRLSEYTPQRSDILDSICAQEVFDYGSFNPPIEHTIVPAHPLEDEEENYFYCECNRFGGSSGSPLLKGNEVVGIMHGGNDKGLCAFLKMGPVLYKIGEYYYSYVDDPLMDSNEFHAIPTPDFKTAFKWYKKAAAMNYPEAIYEIAHCYERGKGVEQNNAEAITWYTKAATQGHVESQYILGKHYLEGDIVTKDYSNSIHWFQLAAEKQNLASLYELGVCAFHGYGFKKSHQNAIEWFNLAVKGWEENKEYAPKELQYAYYYLGRCYLENNSFPFTQVAVSYFQEAGGIDEALYYLGLCYYNGWGTKKDYKKAIELFKQASGCFGEIPQKAAFEVAMCYYNGYGVERDYEEAVRWLKKTHDCDEATFQLGLCYYKGNGVEKGYDEALRYFLQVAEKGNIKAQQNVASLYRKRGESKEDKSWIEKAIDWYLKLWKQGEIPALWSIGYCYETMGNIGNNEKYEEAISWYKQAWDNNISEALISIKNCYESLFNLGHIEKCEEAIRWYKQAWNQGYIDALEYIGSCYEAMYNLGDKEKINDAIIWYKKAAEFKVHGACVSLCNIYKNGKGIPKDDIESEKWAILADKYNPMSKIFGLAKSK